MKWVTIPLSFFFFKSLIQASYFINIYKWIKYAVFISFLFLSINLALGALGLGMAFYFHGYGNAVGTRGFIYAGNELTILVLTIGFLIATYLKQSKRYLLFLTTLLLFIVFAFLITSKTVLGGVLVVFLIPWISNFSRKISPQWLKIWFTIALLGLPILMGIFYYGLTQSGVVEKLKTSSKMNDGDFWQTLLSNRNNFLIDGWNVFEKNYNWLEKIVGLGQRYYVNLVRSIPELDFFTLLFTNGVLGLSVLLMLIYYWFLNAKKLSQAKDYIYANSVILFLIFITISSNLAGHIFSSAIAGFYIGLALAIMFVNKKNFLKNDI
ncbi:O-antigen ligase family protein [Mesonia ostreae]|uniref:O-antigen ligase family protein n=1 Tax=Mesonia ostreae TaxID=861110 RepID=A0ABU2KIW2_9FLAO|nr:O-antigen ligase family protein [Mesonia ostreae]MDT0294656.1 O-antigen ligase family protein [Mesonia ostreae]